MKYNISAIIQKLRHSVHFVLPAVLLGTSLSGCSTQLITGQLDALKTRLISTVDTALALEAELGYGGLIHNFKNSVLRPEEPSFALAAVKNAEQARRHLQTLENTASQMKVVIDLSEVWAMVVAYEQRLDAVAQMAKNGQTAREIDMAVRFDDQYAHKAISVSLARLTNATYDEVSTLQQLVFVLFFGVMFAALISFFGYRNYSRSRLELGRVTAMNAALDDANSDLSAANLSIGRFAGIASHDLRAPIRHIAFFASELEREADHPEQVKSVAQRLIASADRMDALVSSLLEFSKVQFKAPELTVVESAKIVRDCLTELESEFTANNAVVDVSFDELPEIRADENLLLRVFSNLVGNALKYTREGGAPHIRISGEDAPQNTIFHIEDNGIGIDEKYRERIFEPMQRLHGKNEYSGVGIGLSLVKSIIESHRGSVWVTSADSGGSRFSFSIPKVAQASD